MSRVSDERRALDQGSAIGSVSVVIPCFNDGAFLNEALEGLGAGRARGEGVVIVCAAGNSFREGVGYPAAHPECIAVSAVGPTVRTCRASP